MNNAPTPTGDPQPGQADKVALFCKFCGTRGKPGTIEAEWPFIPLTCPGCGGGWKINNSPRCRRALVESQGAPSPAPAGDQDARTLVNLILGTAQGAADGYRAFADKPSDDPHIQTYNEIQDLAKRALALLPAPASPGTVQAPAAGPRRAKRSPVRAPSPNRLQPLPQIWPSGRRKPTRPKPMKERPMPNLITPPELAEEIANEINRYGVHKPELENDGEALKDCPCRMCYVMDLTRRIRESVRNEGMLAFHAADPTFFPELKQESPAQGKEGAA